MLDATNIQETATKAGTGEKSGRFLLTFGVAIVISASSLGTYLYMHRNAEPLPQTIVRAVNFSLYYPSPLPQSYAYVKGSTKLTKGILFYAIASGKQRISISEQTAPSDPPDLTRLPGFTNCGQHSHRDKCGPTRWHHTYEHHPYQHNGSLNGTE